MIKYSITIIDNSDTDAKALKRMISEFCINISSIEHVRSIQEGISEVNNNRPDIIFFNVEFQDLLIFDFLDKFLLDDIPKVFLSSSREFALNAFENNAVDFILKPLAMENVIHAVNKSVKRIETNRLQFEKRFFNSRRNNDFGYLAIVSLDKIDFVKKEDVIFCMADGKYTTISLRDGRKIVSSKNLGEYEKVLDSVSFYRIHHGYIINIRYLVSIRKKEGFYCELVNKISIPVSKRRQESFTKFIKLRD
ncbi:LytR/AlgR family response regulator transcription factor [Flavobacterium oncorhynchi]|uniref:LytR/AlgR family response regulator transcription factor n=1 Tax=Flavobacterium oncorhynchi TaxID=728056 RepID=UPI00351A9F60